MKNEPTLQSREPRVRRPHVDIVEHQDAFLVTADLPGVDESHVDVRLEKGVLRLEADLAVENDPTWTPLHAEYATGRYRREFALSEHIDAEGIEASLRDGVLELRLPKTAAHQPRRVEVRAG